LGERADAQCTEDSTYVVKNGEIGDGNGGEAVDGFEEIRVEILRAMRETGDDGHQQDKVEEDATMIDEGAQDSAEALCAGAHKGGGLGREDSKHGYENGNRNAGEEDGLPAATGLHDAHGNGSQQVVERGGMGNVEVAGGAGGTLDDSKQSATRGNAVVAKVCFGEREVRFHRHWS